MAGSELYRFGRFTLTLRERRLSAGTTTIRLMPKAFDLLAALLQHPGRLMTKDELLTRVWPETFVEEGILTVHVSTLRKVLGDRKRAPAFIETVPRRGYRFIAEVAHEEHSASPEPHRPAELYELVGRGRTYLLSGTHGELPRAVEAFRAATAMDPTYPLAHAGMARARCTQAVLRTVPHQQAFAEARASALRALALEEGSADAHAALGTVQFLSEWDWESAARSLRRALQINPDLTEALLHFGALHDALGQLDEGLRLKQRALARDPLSPIVLLHIALSYLHQRRYDEALAWAGRALEINPGHLLAAVFAASVYWRTGDIDGFIAHNLRTAAARGVSPETFASLEQVSYRMRQVHATAGMAGWSEFMVDQLAIGPGDVNRTSSTAAHRAMLCGAAAKFDEAFACLDEAIAVRDPSTVYLAVAPQWDPLRDDPRFADRLHALPLHAADTLQHLTVDG
jgi:DNA-binding winged helix-turn-helix (wHTH) protein